LREAESTINQRLERPPLPSIDPNHEDFQFFCIDIDHYTDKPPRYIPETGIGRE
jgi:hypothetical protein